MKRSVISILSLCAVAMTASAAPAGTNATPKIERLALFKNGLGYASASATLPHSKTVQIGQLPVPSYGTFWVGYPRNVKVRSLKTAMETVEETVPVSSIDQLLRLNPGRMVTLRLSGTTPAELPIVTGIVQPTAPTPPAPEPPSPYFMDVRRPSSSSYYPSYPQPQPGLILVKAGGSMVAIAPGAVQRAEFVDANPVCVATNQQKRPAIRLELETPAGGEKIGISFLARGITWVPGYRIDLSDDTTARFSAQAQIINEMADIEEAAVDLVTGFPNIQFGELPNPAAMSQSLADFLKSLSSGRAEGGERGHMMQQQAISFNNYVSLDSAPLPAYSTATAGQTAEDLFLYPLDKLSLKNGETATIPLFTAEMPYRHLYTWKIGDTLDGDTSRPRGDGKSAEEVWHICRLVNTAKMPLTTAVAEFIKDGQFVGQDTCYYTAPGAEASIRINRAMNVLAEQSELEIERKRNVGNFYGWNYDLVKLNGELKVRNRLEKAVNLEITKELSGEVLEKSDEAKDVQTARGLKQINPKHLLTWLLEIKPGEERKVTYTYQLYIRP